MLSGKTIVNTPIGALLNAIAPNFRPIWALASAAYAANASRAVAVVRYVSPTSLWRIERAILEFRGVPIAYF